MEHIHSRKIEEIEIGHLELRYEHTRIRKPEVVSSLVNSMERCGQINPVITLKEEVFSFVLVDGYHRVEALKRLGRDTVLAQIWHLKEAEALIMILVRNQERRWEALEEACLIRELQQRHKFSQDKIASLLGRNKSWVSRRICLVSVLPEVVLESVRRGDVSTWSASRVLAPLARANPEHATALTKNLIKEHISTRDLVEFFRHYQKTNRDGREKMVRQPVLFLKALRVREEDEQARSLKEGPEGRWLKEIKMAGHILRRLLKQVPAVIYPGQSKLDRRVLLTAFEDTKGLFEALDLQIRRLTDDDNSRAQRNHSNLASAGDQDPTDQSDAQHLKEHCA
jgi:ParB/RepB/Spo0J family partition protein